MQTRCRPASCFSPGFVTHPGRLPTHHCGFAMSAPYSRCILDAKVPERCRMQRCPWTKGNHIGFRASTYDEARLLGCAAERRGPAAWAHKPAAKTRTQRLAGLIARRLQSSCCAQAIWIHGLRPYSVTTNGSTGLRVPSCAMTPRQKTLSRKLMCVPIYGWGSFAGHRASGPGCRESRPTRL